MNKFTDLEIVSFLALNSGSTARVLLTLNQNSDAE